MNNLCREIRRMALGAVVARRLRLAGNIRLAELEEETLQKRATRLEGPLLQATGMRAGDLLGAWECSLEKNPLWLPEWEEAWLKAGGTPDDLAELRGRPQ